MNAVFVALFAFLVFVFGYHFYAGFLSRKLFTLKQDEPVPAHQFKDGIDYVPTQKHILFGHHFTSIAGAGPIVGPAVAVIWGWLPAVLWVIFGTLFIGAVHDFGCLVLSIRHQVKSMGELTESVIGPRARNLFLILIFFLVWLVIAVFAYVIASLFVSYPQSVIPINFEIIVAILIGLFIYHGKGKLLWPSILAVCSLYAMVFVGIKYPVHIPVLWQNETQTWILFLLFYSFLASTLPVWLLLQPRDYINSHQLFVALGGLYLGLFIYHPEIVAPATNFHANGAPPWFPFLFITIACGAISGFHGLVSSGTSSKQLNSALDAKFIGYGGMVGESLLGLMAVLATTAGFASITQWHHHYASWESAGALANEVGAFVSGCSTFLWHGLGLETSLGNIVIVVVVISFAATTLDTATRIQRYILEEVFSNYGWKFKNRYVTGALAAFTPLILITGGHHWKQLWPIFGASNQLLGALSLLVISIFLLKKGKNALYTLIPCIFISFITLWSMLANAIIFYQKQNWLLTGTSTLLLALAVWIVFEGIFALRNFRIIVKGSKKPLIFKK